MAHFAATVTDGPEHVRVALAGDCDLAVLTGVGGLLSRNGHPTEKTGGEQHTGSGGRVLIWPEPGRVRCEAIDQGEPPSFGRAMPSADQPRGRGLAIVERICDGVTVTTRPDGTAICLTMLL